MKYVEIVMSDGCKLYWFNFINSQSNVMIKKNKEEFWLVFDDEKFTSKCSGFCLINFLEKLSPLEVCEN